MFALNKIETHIQTDLSDLIWVNCTDTVKLILIQRNPKSHNYYN